MPSFYLYFLFSYFASAAFGTLDIKTTNKMIFSRTCTYFVCRFKQAMALFCGAPRCFPMTTQFLG